MSQFDEADVVKLCGRVVGLIKQGDQTLWIERKPEHLIDFADNHIPIPVGHLGVECDLALGVIIGKELSEKSTHTEIQEAINGYASLLLARKRGDEYKARNGEKFAHVDEFSDGTAISSIVNTAYAQGIESSAVWFSVDDHQVQSVKLADIPLTPVQLVHETLKKTHSLSPADVVIYAHVNGHYCHAGQNIEVGLEGFLRSLFTVEKASEVCTAVHESANKHEKLVQHVVEELID